MLMHEGERMVGTRLSPQPPAIRQSHPPPVLMS